MSISSFGVTPPVGLAGELMMTSRVRSVMGEHGLGVEGEAAVLAQRDRHRRGAGEIDDAFCRSEKLGLSTGSRPGLAEHQHREEHRRLAAGHDDDVVGVDSIAWR
ncbi:MAG: hypothetical protein R3D80_04335 [Paracoccaceae bacterium]